MKISYVIEIIETRKQHFVLDKLAKRIQRLFPKKTVFLLAIQIFWTIVYYK